MRQIKFRVFDKDENCMVYGVKINESGKYEKYRNSFCEDIDSPDVEDIYYKYLDVFQYIGLKDKNSKEIYEGDILEDDEGSKISIVWDESECRFTYCLFPFNDLQMESYESISFVTEWKVIGNIYENKELFLE